MISSFFAKNIPYSRANFSNTLILFCLIKDNLSIPHFVWNHKYPIVQQMMLSQVYNFFVPHGLTQKNFHSPKQNGLTAQFLKYMFMGFKY